VGEATDEQVGPAIAVDVGRGGGVAVHAEERLDQSHIPGDVLEAEGALAGRRATLRRRPAGGRRPGGPGLGGCGRGGRPRVGGGTARPLVVAAAAAAPRERQHHRRGERSPPLSVRVPAPVPPLSRAGHARARARRCHTPCVACGAMARVKTVFRCTACGAEAPKWAGWCNACDASGTLVEEPVAASHAPAVGLVRPSTPVPVAEALGDATEPVPTGDVELDRVLGGGLVPGSVTLLGGEPGVGKPTRRLQALASVAERRAAGGDRRRATCLYVTAEESARQVALRAERLGVRTPSLWLVAETALPHVVAHIDALAPDVVVVDSIQTVHDPELGSAPGSVGQVRGCAQQLLREAKARGTSVVLVGHVTKDGGLAGPRVLEHMVDTVLSCEGERHHALRMLRAVKHRFGGTHELGLYEMGDRGLVGVPDPSALFLADRQPGVPGSVVA